MPPLHRLSTSRLDQIIRLAMISLRHICTSSQSYLEEREALPRLTVRLLEISGTLASRIVCRTNARAMYCALRRLRRLHRQLDDIIQGRRMRYSHNEREYLTHLIEGLQEATAMGLSRFWLVPQDHSVYYLDQTLWRVDPLSGGVWTRLHLLGARCRTSNIFALLPTPGGSTLG